MSRYYVPALSGNDEVNTENETSKTVKGPDLPEVNYGDYEFVILTRVFTLEDPWGVNEVKPEAEDGEVLNDSVVERNRVVEERYGIKISQMMNDATFSTASKSIMAGDNEFDAVWTSLFDCTLLAKGNYAYDINSLPYINLKNEWWDQSSVRDLSIGTKQYFVTGDFSYKNYNASWIYAFNKNMIGNFALENPYELVNDGAWTIDKLKEMITDVSADVDGNGVMDEFDRYGIITEQSNTFGMFIGAENFVVAKDSENYPKISINTERGVNTLEKIFSFINDRSVVTSVTEPYIGKYSDVWGALVNIFTDDRGLFYSIVMYTVKKLRNMDSDFGLIPMPKYDENQEKYYTWTSPWISSGLVVPNTVSDAERVSVILEAMTYESMISIRPAYYEVSLSGKYTRDSESSDMIDVILSNRVYDLSMVYDWGGVGMLLNNMTAAKQNNFASKYEAIAGKAQEALEKTIAEFKSIG